MAMLNNQMVIIGPQYYNIVVISDLFKKDWDTQWVGLNESIDCSRRPHRTETTQYIGVDQNQIRPFDNTTGSVDMPTYICFQNYDKKPTSL